MKSEISILHQKYKTMTSTNLHNTFKTDPSLWEKYHAISEENESSFSPESIPRNRIISELDKQKINPKRPKLVVDMGCGKAHIAEHFKDDSRFIFHNYDHISSSPNITECDISRTPLEDNSVDFCILSLAMWGSNCQEYLAEAHRILDSNGKLYIIEPTKRWSKVVENSVVSGSEGEDLICLLESTGFETRVNMVDKFCFIICTRTY
jgi:ribosomal RNA-processing protein 8